jgi:hypothetical protein
VGLFVAAAGLWAGLTLGLHLLPNPSGAVQLVPLIALAAAFEALNALYVGVERIGRFVQVHYEGAEPSQGSGVRTAFSGSAPLTVPCWETTSMMFGTRFPASGPDPLFAPWFAVAALVNFMLAPAPIGAGLGWLIVRLVAHLIFGWRIWVLSRIARRLRAADLDRFRLLKGDRGPEA